MSQQSSAKRFLQSLGKAFLVPNSQSHAAAAKSPQSCRTLCDPIGGSPPGSPVPGILQFAVLWATNLSLLSRFFSNKK